MSLASDRSNYMNEWRSCKNNGLWGDWENSVRDILSTFLREHQKGYREKLESFYNERFARYQSEISVKIDDRRRESPLHRWKHDDEIAQIECDFCNDVYDEFMHYLMDESLIDKKEW